MRRLVATNPLGAFLLLQEGGTFCAGYNVAPTVVSESEIAALERMVDRGAGEAEGWDDPRFSCVLFAMCSHGVGVVVVLHRDNQ